MNSFLRRDEIEKMGFAYIGQNVFISRNASFYGTKEMQIGDNVRIDDFCILSGKIILHSYIHIAAFCGLYGGEPGIEMMDYSGLSSRCVVYAASDDYSGAAMTNPMIPDKYRHVIGGKVTFERHSLIGTGSTVLPNVTVGEGTTVGAMSLILKTLDPWGIYVGIPCKRIKERSKKPLELEAAFRREIGEIR